jgi:hypothetical protein
VGNRAPSESLRPVFAGTVARTVGLDEELLVQQGSWLPVGVADMLAAIGDPRLVNVGVRISEVRWDR